jgi:hypothetical protein
MADIIIDEWLWADLAGENSSDAKEQAFNFISRIYQKCDRIVMVKESKFMQKLWAFCKDANDIWNRKIANFYNANFTYNMSKSVILEWGSLQSIPEQVVNETNPDDHYLIQALVTVDAQVVLVTTDRSLKDVLSRHGFNCALRNEFVKGYIST